MRPRARLFVATIVVVLCALVAPAAAKKRVALLTIDGRGGDDVTVAVEEVLSREATVLSDGLFRRRQERMGITFLNEKAYARISAALLADGVVTGTWRSAGRRFRLTLVVRSGRTGAVVGRVVEVVRERELSRDEKDAIAAKLLPLVRDLGLVTDDGGGDDTVGDTTGDGAGDGDTSDAGTADGGDGDGGGAPDGDGATADTGDGGDGETGTDASAGGDTSDADDTADDTAGGTESFDDESWSDESEGGIGPIGGKTFAYVRAPLDGDEFQQVSASVWLNARPRFSDTASASFELAFDGIETSVVTGQALRIALREAYVSLRKRGWLLRAGQQIQPWGASDVINPTDFLTARDFRFFVVDNEQSRKGALSVLLAHATPRFEVKLVVTPRFPASSVLVPSAALPAGVTIAEPAPISADMTDTEVAAKIKLSGRGWDIALVGFRGWNHTPELELVSATETELVMRHTHRRIVAGGLDGSASIGKFVFRAEGSYILPLDNAEGEDISRLPPMAFAVIGVERPLGDRVRVQAQLIGRHYPYWRDPADEMDPVAATNALFLDYQDQRRPSGTLRVAYQSEEGRLEAEVFGAMNFLGSDFLVRPLLGWRPVETVTLQVGVDVYGGPDDRPLGALNPFSGAFGQVSYTF
ncbi:MAG: hypothetical protein K8M05_22040 [Deltaproteobacteria bacterium]|nr:hypothetical protein [Kofleriaceae bacterium]